MQTTPVFIDSRLDKSFVVHITSKQLKKYQTAYRHNNMDVNRNFEQKKPDTHKNTYLYDYSNEI